MNREDIWTISKTISSREPRLLGPKVGDTEIFKNAWKSFFNSFQIIWETFHFFHLEKYSGTCEVFVPAKWYDWKFPYRRLWDPVAAAPGYLWSWKWFICLPYSSMRLMLLIGKTYNPYLVWNQPYQSGSIWNRITSYHFVSLIRQKNFTSPRIFFKVKKMKCLSNDLKRIKKWFSCIFKNFRIADFGTQ